jgi:hypothetical protein
VSWLAASMVVLVTGGSVGAAMPLQLRQQDPLDHAYALLADGDVEAGRVALLAVAADRPPSESVDLVRLVRLLDRLGDAQAERGARAAGLAHVGRLNESLETLEEGLDDEEHAPVLLSLGARLADEAGEPARAAELRETLVTRYSSAADRPEAIIALARYRRAVGERADETAALLEGLIIDQPNHALGPAARRELERLRSGGA